MSRAEIVELADPVVRETFGRFVREFNRRENAVRSGRVASFAEYYEGGHYCHSDDHGTGWIVAGNPVPYFHPNRSFHDEIIWLNENLYYDESASFDDRLINSAIVKFYGPASTLDAATSGTGWDYVNVSEYRSNAEYRLAVLGNIEAAAASGAKLWGTTELRSSLQTAAGSYAREVPTEIDLRGDRQKLDEGGRRKMRPSDMVHWIMSLAPKWIEFFKTKPDMESAFGHLTEVRGIGNYYGYHFASNLARMPGVGSPSIIEADGKTRVGFDRLKSADPTLEHGRLDENADYVVAGPGAIATLKRLFPSVTVNGASSLPLILAIRDNQEEFFGIAGDTSAEADLRESSELGRFTTFGIEIACCQYNVFERAAASPAVALQRSQAPISKEVGSNVAKSSVADVFE